MAKVFTVEDLLGCYENGVFPMADTREDEDIFLIDPAERGVLPLAGFHVPRRLRRQQLAQGTVVHEQVVQLHAYVSRAFQLHFVL